MLSVRGLPRLRASGTVPRIISTQLYVMYIAVRTARRRNHPIATRGTRERAVRTKRVCSAYEAS